MSSSRGRATTSSLRAGSWIARQPDRFAEAALKIGESRKLDPSPWEERIFYDHPGGRTRIYAAMRWKSEMNAATTPHGEK